MGVAVAGLGFQRDEFAESSGFDERTSHDLILSGQELRQHRAKAWVLEKDL